MDQTLVAAASFLARALSSFTRALAGTNDSLTDHFEKLGWILPEVPQALKDLQSASNQVAGCLAKLEQGLRQVEERSRPESDLEEPAAELLLALTLLAAQIRELPAGLRSQLPSAFVAATHIDEQIQKRLYDDALSRHLEYESNEIYLIARVLGFVETVPRDADPACFQPAFEERIIRSDRLLAIPDGPAALMRDVYGWGTPVLDSAKLFLALRDLSFVALSPAFFDYPSQNLLGAIAPGLRDNTARERGLLVSLFQGAPLELSFGLYPLPKQKPDELQGLVAILTGLASIQQLFQLAPSVSLKINSQIDLASGIAVAVWPDRPPKILGNVATAAAQLIRSGSAEVELSYAPADESERLPLLSFASFNLDSRGLSLNAGVGIGTDAVDAFVEVSLTKLRVQLGALGQDSFLARVMPGSVTAEFDLVGGWSTTEGFRWRGKTGPEISIPVALQIGPVALQKLDISFASPNGTFQVALGVSGSCLIGPVLVEVEGIGVAIAVNTQGGNLGPIDLRLSPVPPKGVGLAIDAAVAVGGGFLRFDPQKAEYGGILQLEIAEKIAVKAFGLLTTRMPDGSEGYSLVLIIFVEDFAPIQLGLGFALTGIGGLLAINRTFDEEALRAGLKNHTLDSVMFPKDPIRNAPQILSNLNRVFPPADGHHLFGPMVQIAWGTPALITADLGVVLELGARLRLLILAQIVAILPRRENDLVRLQMDAIGVLDFDHGSASLDATLYDSRLLKKFVLTGDMAMRLKWEASPNFALAIGGLHPAFNPPPSFPKLERIAINLSAGDNPRFRCEAYFALTANTVQFGARAELYAAVAGFSIHGETGFDVLIQFDPFYFLADFYAQLQLKRDSTNLFKVRVEGALEGPRPLHIKAKATFEVLWWDVSIRVDKTLVEGEKPPLPEPIDVLPRLKEALGNPGNWTSQLPEGQRPLVTVRAKRGAEVLLHPLGTLSVKQSVVPLNLDISRFGQAAPAGVRRFTISSVNQTAQPLKDFFAPAQFFEMSDDEKLSRPSFEAMVAGVSIVSEEFAFSANAGDWLEVKAIEFETWIVDKGKNVVRRSDPEDRKNLYKLSPRLLGKQARFGAAGNSDLRRTGKAKYRTTRGKHQVVKEGWSIVATEDLTVQPVPGIEEGKPTIYSEAVQALRKLKRENPAKAAGLKILRLSEVRATN